MEYDGTVIVSHDLRHPTRAYDQSTVIVVAACGEQQVYVSAQPLKRYRVVYYAKIGGVIYIPEIFPIVTYMLG